MGVRALGALGGWVSAWVKERRAADEVDDELVPIEDVVSVEDAVSEPLASVEVVPSLVDVVSVEELSEEFSDGRCACLTESNTLF